MARAGGLQHRQQKWKDAARTLNWRVSANEQNADKAQRIFMQVHKSKVVALAFSAKGDALWSGCDAVAPRPGPDAGPDSQEPPVALISCKVGAAPRD